ncbi:MAG TPA: pyridoxal 5'-phosphate synthase glutaminase subunit PdxT [Prevotellaceae bacterium]|nr:pyridoxal 5'-phosphate synthase glutaminase subunit PdxT [Prevotellaceae bacterium]
MRIAIMALQGAFEEHRQVLERMGEEPFLVRNIQDWHQEKRALIIPGGESTTMTRIMHDLGMWDEVRQEILGGLPVLGTCAGLIMLDRLHLDTMDILAKRNAYGRQLGSFHTEGDFQGLGSVPMTFIRAPYIEEVGAGVEVLARVNGHIVAARQGNQLVTAFHPELDSDTRIHQMLLEMAR